MPLHHLRKGYFSVQKMGSTTAKRTAHYGRFIEIERPARIEHTLVSPNTLGEESQVSLTLRRKGKDTLLTLVHSGIPDTERGQRHQCQRQCNNPQIAI